MAEYDGTIGLLDEHGNVIAEVQAHLLSYHVDGLPSWSGHIQRTEVNADEWTKATRIRLPNSNEGAVVLTESVTMDASGTTRIGELHGSGPAPF